MASDLRAAHVPTHGTACAGVPPSIGGTHGTPATHPPAGLFADVAAILGKFRDEHGWQPGMTWDPYAGTYTDTERNTA